MKVQIYKGKTIPVLRVLPDKFLLDFARIKYKRINENSTEYFHIIDTIYDEKEIDELLIKFKMPFLLNVEKTESNTGLSKAVVNAFYPYSSNIYVVEKARDFTIISKEYRPLESVLDEFRFDEFIALLKYSRSIDEYTISKIYKLKRNGIITEKDMDATIIDFNDSEVREKEIGENTYLIDLYQFEVNNNNDNIDIDHRAMKESTELNINDINVRGSFYYKIVRDENKMIIILKTTGNNKIEINGNIYNNEGIIFHDYMVVKFDM